MAASTFYNPFTPDGTGTGAIGKYAHVRTMTTVRYAFGFEGPPAEPEGPSVPTTGQLWPRGDW